MRSLEEFKLHHGSLPQNWGKVDCCLVLADWAMWLGEKKDAAAFLRDTYSTEWECRNIIRKSGGLVKIIDSCTAQIGWVRVERPEAGSIGVIGSRIGGSRQFGSIYDGQNWLIRLQTGFQAFKAQPLAIWSRPCQSA